ncbi:MAG: hypothetical protein A3G81_25980 [Betaproteobacteria bacterium RIFCSPLOWO2_12_FULL_65_14]|nr:MAG: hypothetical protein A3G81_25980 [Betaproteobacteria bacterium RIFCSPLOWO2_12_FULL_65_14]
MKITVELIFDGQSIFGGWSRKQVECLGVCWPLRRGWIALACEQEITPESARRFLALKDQHVDPLDLEHHRNLQHLRSIAGRTAAGR